VFSIGVLVPLGAAYAQEIGYKSQEEACVHFSKITSLAAYLRFETGAPLAISMRIVETSPINDTEFRLASAKLYVRDFYMGQISYFEIYDEVGKSGFKSNIFLRCMLAAEQSK
jgi:hypothetical protein